MSPDDEFWAVVFEAHWAHHLGQPFGMLAGEKPSAEASTPVGTLTAAAGWCAPYDPEAAVAGDTPATEEPDSFVATLVDSARQNLSNPGEAASAVVLRAAGEPTLLPEQLDCGCSIEVLETGLHQPGCTVLDIPAATEGSP